MSRRIVWAAWLLVVIQVAAFLLIAAGPLRDLISNLIQIATCITASAFCVAASRRGRDLARTFWVLFALAFIAYGLANVIWTYYENWLRTPVPFSPVSQFLYLCYDAPMVMALFLREGEDTSGLDWQRSLDFVQMLMVSFLVYYDFLFLRALPAGRHSLELMEQGMTNILNFVLLAAFFLRSLLSRAPLVRSLCRTMSIYLLVYAVSAGIGDYALTFIHATSGSWSSLAWTVPFVVAAMLAAGYEQPAETIREATPQLGNKRAFLLKNAGLALLPLTATTAWLLTEQ
jgi:hypothetical protein